MYVYVYICVMQALSGAENRKEIAFIFQSQKKPTRYQNRPTRYQKRPSRYQKRYVCICVMKAVSGNGKEMVFMLQSLNNL